MDFDQKKKLVLALLADEWERSGPPGRIFCPELCAKSGIDGEELVNVVSSLRQTGSVNTDIGTNYAELSVAGYLAARPEDPVAVHGKQNQTIINAPVQGSVIAVDHSSVHAAIVLEKFLADLAGRIGNHPEIPEEKKKQWLPLLWEISRHPIVQEIGRKLLGSLG